MAKMKPASISIFLLVFIKYVLMVSEVVTREVSEGINYNIPQLVDNSLEREKEDWSKGKDSLQNVLKEEELHFHYETDKRLPLSPNPSFSSKVGKIKRRKRSVTQRSVIIPWLYQISEDTSPAYLLRVMDRISSFHSRIYILFTDWVKLENTLDQLASGERLSQPLKATVYVATSLRNSNQAVASREKLERRNIFLENLDFGWDQPSQKPTWFDSAIGGIPVLCDYNFGVSSIQPSTAMERTRESCGFLFHHAAAFQWELVIDYLKAAEANYSMEFYKSHILQRLNEAVLARQEIQKVKPNVKVKLIMQPYFLPAKDPTFNFYCDQDLLRANTYFEEIGSWARINDFPVVIQNIFPDFPGAVRGITWWSFVKVGDEVIPDITKNIPVYVYRNFRNESPDPHWNLDSCVEWSGEIAQGGIPFDTDFTGGTLHMRKGEETLTVNELETMLLFSLHKFKSVELVPRNGARQLRDLQTFNLLLENDFIEVLQDLGEGGGNLYLDISVESGNCSEIFEQIEKLAEKISLGLPSILHLSGLHLTNWESQTSPEAVLERVSELGQKYNFKVGLVVNNCATLLNKLATSKNSTVPPSDYILCLTKTFPADNANKEAFATNLDTHLYMSKIFESFLPGRAIYFRVNSVLCCYGDSEEKKAEKLFRFLNDVSQFAVGNKLKHFLIQAFPASSDTTSRSSWFQVENYRDLSDISVFTDREEAITNKTFIWRPPSTSEREERRRQRKKKIEDSSPGPSTETVFIVVFAIAGLKIVIMAFWHNRK